MLLKSQIRVGGVIAAIALATSAAVLAGTAGNLPWVAERSNVAASPEASPSQNIASSGVLIRLSTDRAGLAGYSFATGTWEAAPTDNAADLFGKIIVGDSVAAGVQGRRAFAFSGATGKWVAIELPLADQAIVVGTNYARIECDGKLYLFSAATGGWADPLP